jgi:uncharacterized membrane protein
MSDDRKRAMLSPTQLSELLNKLDEVMSEAQRLRHQVTRQLSEQRRGEQQRVTTTARRRKTKER